MRKSLFQQTIEMTLALCFIYSGTCFANAQDHSSLEHLKFLQNHFDQIVGIEILVAGAKDNRPESQFGHTMLRFVMKDGDVFSDPVVTFGAEVNSAEPSIAKGLLGGYAVNYYIQTLGETYLSYLSAQERPIRRHVLPSNSAVRKSLVSKLVSWSQNPKEMGRYFFVGQNCTDVLFSLLDASGIKAPNPLIAIPVSVSEMLTQSLLTALPHINTLEPLKMRSKINSASDLRKISTVELQRIFYSLNRSSDLDMKLVLLDVLKQRTDLAPLYEVYNLTPLSPIAYELCLKGCDVQRFGKVVLNELPPMDPKIYQAGVSEIKRASQLAGASNKLNTPYAYHFRLTQNILYKGDHIGHPTP